MDAELRYRKPSEWLTVHALGAANALPEDATTKPEHAIDVASLTANGLGPGEFAYYGEADTPGATYDLYWFGGLTGSDKMIFLEKVAMTCAVVNGKTPAITELKVLNIKNLGWIAGYVDNIGVATNVTVKGAVA